MREQTDSLVTKITGAKKIIKGAAYHFNMENRMN